MSRDSMYFGIGSCLVISAGGMQILARKAAGTGTWYAHHVYPVLVEPWGRIMGLFPFSVVEIGLYLLSVGSMAYVGWFWRKPKRVASRGIFVGGLLLFLYTANCGINYYADSFAKTAGLETGLYSREELIRLCEFLLEKVNETAVPEGYQGNERAWKAEGVQAMKGLGETYPALAGFYPMPKEVAVSWILSVQQLTGIYSPFTIEANFNGSIPNYNIPHTICHELSHLKGFMREEEANFIGYLACVNSDQPAFRYSGYLTGWVYAGNALAREDWEAYVKLQEGLCDQARADLVKNNEFWNQYEGKVAEVANQMNDVYLKINDQKDGVKSYGRMVDLMLGYYKTIVIQYFR